MWLPVLLCLHVGMVCGCLRKSDHCQDDVLQMTVSPETEASDKVWLFAVDGRRRPYSFLNSTGQLVGFDVDFVNGVCNVAGKKCKLVLSEFTECTVTERDINYAGRGLMSGWFDACPGYVVSLDRLGAFDFTKPYLETDASFTVAPGNPKGFDADSDDFSGFTLTHLNGAVTNSRCLGRLQKKFDKIIIAKDLPDAKQLLLNGTADALFSPRTQIDGLEVLPTRVHCETGGTAIMLKKGSSLAAWWNPAFEQFVNSSAFAMLCTATQIKYRTRNRCLSKELIQSQDSIATSVLTYNVPQQKVWLFAVSGRRKPFNYLDDQGNLVGFDVDFINLVCTEAKQTCSAVLAEFTECTITDRNINYPGRGLMDGWFDACTGYGDSVDRENSFDFTNAYLMSDASYTVSEGNPSGFDPDLSDYSNYTFTHLDGAYTNAACLTRLKKKFGKIIIAENLPDAKRLLASREADVLFSPRSRIPGLETLPARVHCEKRGTAMMAKKGSPLIAWWNKAYQAVVANGQYKQFCEQGRIKYNYPVRCFSDA